jgi:hypothetical protein
MRAEEASGNAAAARALAEQILARYPRGPHAARAREVVER